MLDDDGARHVAVRPAHRQAGGHRVVEGSYEATQRVNGRFGGCR